MTATQSLRRHLAYSALLLLFAVAVFWKLIFNDEYSILTYPDCAFQTYPWAQYIASALHQGSFPFWDHYSDAGRSFIGEAQTGAFYPVNILMGFLPLNARGLTPALVIEGFIILHCFLASLLMYCLATHLGLSRFSACIAGIVFAYGGSIGMRASAQINLLYSSVWLPAIFLFYSKSLQAKQRSRQILFANLAGLCLALSLLAGHHQPFIYSALALLCATLVLWLSRRKPSGDRESPQWSARHLWMTVLSLLGFAAAYSSLQFLPSLEYSNLAYRWVNSASPTLISERIPYSVVGTDNSFPPHALFLMIFPYISGVENSPYIGILPLVFVALAAGLVKKYQVVWLAFLLALLFFTLSLGHYSPLHGLSYSLIPGFDKGREAARLLLVTHFALSILAGFGCQSFLGPITRNERKWKTRLVWSGCGISVLICLLVFAGYFYRTQVLYQETDYGVPVFACLLLLASSAIALIRVYSWARVAPLRVAILVLLLFDFHLFMAPHIKLKKNFDRKGNNEPKQYYFHDELIDFLKSQTGTFRVDFREGFQPGNHGQVYKLETINGYGATSLKQFYEFQVHHYPPGNIIGDLMNVRFVVNQKELALPKVFSNKNGIVHENPGWLPRAWLVDEAIPKANFGEILPLLQDPSFNPRAVAYIEGSHKFPNGLSIPDQTSSQLPLHDGSTSSDDITFSRQSPNWFVVEAKTMRPRFLVVSENWYPGWKVQTNGKPRTLHRVNGALMGVFVEPGSSKIEFRYRPTRFYLALSLTFVALVSLGVAYWFSRSKSPRNRG
jgi:hypothetical protein